THTLRGWPPQSAAMPRSNRSPSAHDPAHPEPPPATAHAAWPETKLQPRAQPEAPTKKVPASERRFLCYRSAQGESRPAVHRRAQRLSRPRARQTPAAFPATGDGATAAVPAPRPHTPSLLYQRFVLSLSWLQHRP